MNLTGSTAVILGGSSGMGLAAARQLAQAGATVVVTARDSEKLAMAATTLPDTARTAAFDARDTAATERFFHANGRFQHLVLALSSGAAFGPFAELSEQALRDTFENKFWPYVNAMRLSLDWLAQDGSITLIAGSAARKAGRGMAAIAATNGALVAMVGPLALELAPRRVNAVCPGPVDTPYWEHVDPLRRAEMFAETAGRLPVGRMGTAGDVGQAVIYLVTNTFTTGTILDCNGGIHL